MGTYPPLPKRPYCTSSWENAQSLSFCSKLRQCIAAEPLFWDLPPNLLLQYPRTTQGLALHLAPPLAGSLAAPRRRRRLPALTCWRAPHTLHGPRLRAALASLDPFSVHDALLQPCNVFRTPPAFCKPQLRRALRFGLRFIRDATGPDPSAPSFGSENAARAWKLWLFLPRMLLFRPAGTDRVPKPVILARFAAFFRGDWEPLLRAAIAGTSAAPPPDPPPTPVTLMICRVGLSAPPA